MADFPAAGWGFPGSSRKAHYFDKGSSTSLCGSWGLYNADRQPDTHRSPDDCARCRRELDRRAPTRQPEEITT